MKNKIVIRISDTKGFFIRLLICSIMWYNTVIQNRFFSNGYVFVALGMMLTGVIIIEYSMNINKSELYKFPKTSVYIFLYIILTYMFGTVSSPLVYIHKNQGTTVIEFCVIMLFVCYYGMTRKSLDFLIWNEIAIYSFMLIVFFISPAPIYYGENIRYSFSDKLNPNSFAVGLSTAIWAILYKISQKKIKLIIGVPVCAAMMYAIFLTGSRKGLIGALLCILLWFLMYFIPLSGNKKAESKIFKIIIGTLCGILVLIILMPYFNNTIISARMQKIFSDASYNIRVDMYKKGLVYIKKSPFLGYGFSGFEYFFGSYSHATWVEVFVSSGIPIGLIYVLSYISMAHNLIFCNNICKLRRNKENLVIIRQYCILFIMLLFYTTCMIHIYNLESFIQFGMIITTCKLVIESIDVKKGN